MDETPANQEPARRPARAPAGPLEVAGTITTRRLVLSPLQVSDASEMEPVLSAGELYRFTGGSPPSLEELERRFTAQVAGSPDRGETWHNWIIRLLEGGEAVGFVQATVTDEVAEIAWLVGVAWQRQGIATEATIALCDWLHAQGATRVVAHIHPEHGASARVARAAGLEPTGGFDDDGEEIWSSLH